MIYAAAAAGRRDGTAAGLRNHAYIDLSSAVIIRSDYASDTLSSAVRLLKALNEQPGADVRITNDDDMMYGADDPGAVRILFGETNVCPEGSDKTYYSSAVEALGESDHIIMVFEDNTIVLAGKTESAVKRAAKAFAGKYLAGGEKLVSNTAFSKTGEAADGKQRLFRLCADAPLHRSYRYSYKGSGHRRKTAA